MEPPLDSQIHACNSSFTVTNLRCYESDTTGHFLFQDPARLGHQIRHLSEYRLFIFNPKSSLQTPSRAHPMSEMTAVTGRQLIEIEESQLQAFVDWDVTEEG